MAITRVETQVIWPTGANAKTVFANSSQTSEAFSVDATCIAARITLKINVSGTVDPDDQLYFWLVQSSGDPDGTGSDEFDTFLHAQLLAIMDGNVEDPAIRTVQLPLPQKRMKLIADGETVGTSSSISVSAIITEQRA